MHISILYLKSQISRDTQSFKKFVREGLSSPDSLPRTNLLETVHRFPLRFRGDGTHGCNSSRNTVVSLIYRFSPVTFLSFKYLEGPSFDLLLCATRDPLTLEDRTNILTTMVLSVTVRLVEGLKFNGLERRLRFCSL